MKNRNPMKNHVFLVQIKIISFFSVCLLFSLHSAFPTAATILSRSQWQKRNTKSSGAQNVSWSLLLHRSLPHLSSLFMINRFSMFSLVNNTKTHLNKKIRFSFFSRHFLASFSSFLSFFISLLTLNIHFSPNRDFFLLHSSSSLPLIVAISPRKKLRAPIDCLLIFSPSHVLVLLHFASIIKPFSMLWIC